MTHPLKTWRDSLKISQPEAGEKLGVDAMTVSRWERGEHLPHKKHWQNIETVTGIAPSALVEYVKVTEISQ
jgi:transcriptional regulator with XRE-family HTH domain